MRKSIFWGYIVALFFAAAVLVACSGGKKRTIELKDSSIYLDGNPFMIASAEVDYARIPAEYWDHRLSLMAAMGLNTVTIKVPWMLHEPVEGEYNFKGMNDLKKFCNIAQQKGMLVWLHIGPYIGAEWDMGGMPWWLLNIDGINLRSNQPAFMQRVERYFTALSKELQGAMVTDGGNIAVIQIEESQNMDRTDKEYLTALCECAKRTGLDKVLTFTSATKANFMHTAIDGVDFSLDINSETKADEQFTGVTKFRYDAPHICSSVGGDYKTVWGGESAARNWNKVFMRMFELLQRGVSMSLNGVVAGTSFGTTAGATMADGVYKPYTTSHNSDGLLKLWGGFDQEFFGKFRNTLFVYSKDDEKVQPKLPAIQKLAGFPETLVTEYAPMFQGLPEPVEADTPLTMEKLGMGYGAVLYSTLLPETGAGTKLVINGVHDYARVFVDGEFLATLDRRNNDSEVVLPPLKAGTKLDIVVDAMGRVADVKGYKDFKGITGAVELKWADGTSNNICGWKMYSLPSDYGFVSSREFKKGENVKRPGYYRTSFDKTDAGDFYLYVGNWGKGEAWLNGKSLGRFWNCGPQYTLYVPACWLKEKDNELIIMDFVGPDIPVVKGIDYSFM